MGIADCPCLFLDYLSKNLLGVERLKQHLVSGSCSVALARRFDHGPDNYWNQRRERQQQRDQQSQMRIAALRIGLTVIVFSFAVCSSCRAV